MKRMVRISTGTKGCVSRMIKEKKGIDRQNKWKDSNAKGRVVVFKTEMQIKTETTNNTLLRYTRLLTL